MAENLLRADQVCQHGVHRLGAVGRRVGIAGTVDIIIKAFRKLQLFQGIVAQVIQPVTPMGKPVAELLHAPTGDPNLNIQVQAHQKIHQRRANQPAGTGDEHP